MSDGDEYVSEELDHARPPKHVLENECHNVILAEYGIAVAAYYRNKATTEGTTRISDKQPVRKASTSDGYFEVLDLIEHGTFGRVAKCRDRETGEIIAVKRVKTAMSTHKELKAFAVLTNHPAIPQFYQAVHENGAYLIAMQYMPVADLAQTVGNLTVNGRKFYLRQMFLGLDYIHSKGLMHRDIKLENLIIVPEWLQLKIIDYGMAQMYIPGRKYNVVGSIHMMFQAPEVALRYPYYNYAIDMWSAGCVAFAVLCSRHEPSFFHYKPEEMLFNLTKILGSANLRRFVEKYQISTEGYTRLFTLYHRANYFRTILKPVQASFVESLLIFDFQKRPSALQTLQHPYFKDVENIVPCRDNLHLPDDAQSDMSDRRKEPKCVLL
ncbi:unnamed protein product, partial [Mesorhabditis spiculigera]